MVELPYKGGDWIVVPLDHGRFALGRIARFTPGGRVVLGYFFADDYYSVPNLSDIKVRSPLEAILIAKFGDLGLIEGKWPILGQNERWERDNWPVPLMYRQDVISGSWWVSEYSDELKFVREWKIEGDPPFGYTYDSMRGYVALQKELGKLLL